MGKILPDGFAMPAIEPLNEPFFTTGRLMLQVCKQCDTVQHPPEDICRSCQAMELGWCEAAGTGEVYSFTVAQYAIHPDLADRIPYAAAIVQLDDHPHVRVTGNILNIPPDQVEIGLPVRVVFEDATNADGRKLKLPQWEAI